MKNEGVLLMIKAYLNLAELKKAAYGYQKDIACRMDLSVQAVSERLNGHRKMTLEDLNAICDVVRRPASDFIVFSEEEAGTKKAA